MSICRARLRNTSNALTLRMSSEQIVYVFRSRLNCSGSTAGSRRWSSSEFQTLGLATENARVPKVLQWTHRTDSWWHSRSQVLATSNFRDWHTVVGEIPWSSVPKATMDCHSKLVLHSLRNNQPVQVIVHHISIAFRTRNSRTGG